MKINKIKKENVKIDDNGKVIKIMVNNPYRAVYPYRYSKQYQSFINMSGCYSLNYLRKLAKENKVVFY